jgi:uncharacterized protein (DUF2235 family)
MKRLVCCLDGTWNEDTSEDTLTNIVRLRRAIPEIGRDGVRQVVHYGVGIGTGYGGTVGFAVGAAGIEVDDRIRTAHAFLARYYEPGDEIYLFGFSRGAFEARSLGGLLTHVGIPKSDTDDVIDKAWALYENRLGQSASTDLAAFRAEARFPVAITCIGVWDTVGNLGNPMWSGGFVARQFAFHDTSLPASVPVALHALSIDEERGPFRPILWTVPRGAAPPSHQHVEQVWFAGTHADVGGGWPEKDLSDISLVWMAERVSALTPLSIEVARLRSAPRPDPLGPQHASSTGRIFKWSAWLPFIRVIEGRTAVIGPMRHLFFRNWRTSASDPFVVPLNESIHESAIARYGKRVVEKRPERDRQIVYRPPNLAAALRPRRKKDRPV